MAIGSSVPVWPARFSPSVDLTRRTTSKEVGPWGLSMTRTPSMEEKAGAELQV